MTNTICLDENYSTTRLLAKEQPIIKHRPEDKFETILFLPESENRKSENLFIPNEVYEIYGDNAKAKEILGWYYDYSFFDILDILLVQEEKNYGQ